MKTFAIVFQGETEATAEPLLYTDDPAAVRMLVGYLADRADVATIVPDVRLTDDRPEAQAMT